MTVANRFRVHREFLLSQTSKASMIYSPSRKQKMAWSKTSLHQWLTLQEPVCLPEIVSQSLTVKLPDEDLKTFESEPKAALSRKHQKAPTSSSTVNASTEPPVVLISDTEESDSEGPLQHINVQTGSFSSKKAPSEIQSYPLIWKTQKRDQRPRTTRIIVRCIREEVTLSKRDQWTAGKLATHLYFKYSISAPAMAKIIIRTCAKNILKALDAPWHNSHLYKDLQLASTSTHPITINQDKQLAKVVSQYRLVRRKVKSQNAQAGSKEANSKEASGKEAKNVKTPRPHERIVSPEQSHERSGRGIGSGKIPGRRPPLASKRKLAGISDMTETETSELIEAAAISNTRPPQIQTTVTSLPNRKRRRYSPTRTPPPSDRPRPDLTSWNGEPDISSPSVCSDAEADAANRDPDAPPPPLVKKDKTTLGLVSRPMPSIDAQVTGPHETFRCHQNNCNYHMPNAFLPDVQEEIYAHWRWHADQLDRVTRDIENELSIRKKSGRRDTTQHLLEKIMGIGRGIRERENELIDLGVGVRPATNPVVTGFPDRVRKAGVF